MKWEFTAEQVIEGEYNISLTDFTKRLYSKAAEMTIMSIGSNISGENKIDPELNPAEDYRIQFFLCYYNLVLALATGRSVRQFKSFTKKLEINDEIKKKFLNKAYLEELISGNDDTVLIFKAVLKSFVSELIESGTSTSRLPQMLTMQQINSFSSIIPSVMKNENARKMIMHIEFEKSLMSSRLLKMFK
jgi:hypothetical protein